MVKIFTSKTMFDFTWEQVAQGFWQRYPNPESSHVLSEDTVYRKVINGKLYSKRLLTKTNKLPKWGECFVTNKICKILEESIVDPKTKTLTTYTRNLGYQSVMSIVERVEYKMDEENPNKTLAIRTATIDSHVIGFAKAIQAFGLDRFKKNCRKAVNGFNYVLQQRYKHVDGPVSHSASTLKDLAKTKNPFPRNVESI